RTIRRDLAALEAAGFPIYDDVVNGTKFWRLDGTALVDALPRNALTVTSLHNDTRRAKRRLSGYHRPRGLLTPKPPRFRTCV
ncbi:MAG: hypothetical protein DMF89_15775, partial [Acidobacteria bacterium]